jgi:hypothetical protein
VRSFPGSGVGEAGDGCFVGGVAAPAADGDDLDGVGRRRVVWSEPVDDQEPFRLVVEEVEAQTTTLSRRSAR